MIPARRVPRRLVDKWWGIFGQKFHCPPLVILAEMCVPLNHVETLPPAELPNRPQIHALHNKPANVCLSTCGVTSGRLARSQALSKAVLKLLYFSQCFVLLRLLPLYVLNTHGPGTRLFKTFSVSSAAELSGTVRVSPFFAK
jgi:hypothetical protein